MKYLQENLELLAEVNKLMKSACEHFGRGLVDFEAISNKINRVIINHYKEVENDRTLPNVRELSK